MSIDIHRYACINVHVYVYKSGFIYMYVYMEREGVINRNRWEWVELIARNHNLIVRAALAKSEIHT